MSWGRNDAMFSKGFQYIFNFFSWFTSLALENILHSKTRYVEFNKVESMIQLQQEKDSIDLIKIPQNRKGKRKRIIEYIQNVIDLK